MTTLFSSLPSTPNPTPGGTSSLPGTPLSGISTVAIKDGHEGNRHSTHQGEYVPSSAERLARLGGLGVDRGGYGAGGGNISTGEGTSYFDRVSGWRKDVGERNLTSSGSGGSGGSSEREPLVERSIDGSENTSAAGSSSGGEVEVDSRNGYQQQFGEIQTHSKPGNGGSVGSRLAGNSRAPGRIGLPPPIPTRRAPSSFSGLVPAPPCPTPNTPSIQPPQSTLPSRSSLLNPLMNIKEREDSAAGTTATPTNTPAILTSSFLLSQSSVGQNPTILNNLNNNNNSASNSSLSAPTSSSISTPGGAPSPASTATTTSVRQEKDRAKMIGPMTYDEGVIDTTNRSPMRIDNEDEGVGADRDVEAMDGVERTGNLEDEVTQSNTTDRGSTLVAGMGRMPGAFVGGSS